MDRTEWPTESRLEALRQEGKVPLSMFATRLITAAAVISGFAFGAKRITEFLEIYPTLGMRNVSIGQLLQVTWNNAAPLLFGMLAIGFLVTVVAGAFQTKLLFLSTRINLDFRRLNQFRLPQALNMVRRVIGGCILVLAALATSSIVFLFGVRSVLELLNQHPSELKQWISVQFFAVLPIFIGVLLVFALIFWLYSRWLFGMRHRMTRQEVEAELTDE